MKILVIVVCLLLFSGFYAADATSHKSPKIPQHCKSVNDLPDPNCTPGSTNPQVTQKNLQDTICKPGYAKSVRPPVSYTEPLKKKLMASYGMTNPLKDYELDHLIPLEVGGNPTDVKNLWPEPWKGNNGAKEKDKLEDYLHKQVCSGNMDLETAQSEFVPDWTRHRTN